MGALGLIELQCTGEGFQHAFRHPVQVAAFQPGVVVDAHSGEQRDFLPAEPGHPLLLPKAGKRARSGAILARLKTRKSRTSFRLSTATTLSVQQPPWEGLALPGSNPELPAASLASQM
jgi:hypothetical protein